MQNRKSVFRTTVYDPTFTQKGLFVFALFATLLATVSQWLLHRYARWNSTATRLANRSVRSLCILIAKVLLLGAMFALAPIGEPPKPFQASTASAQISTTTPAQLHIMEVDNSYFPQSTISVFSTDLPMDMLRLPVQILETPRIDPHTNLEFQPYPGYIGAERILVINTHNLDVIGVEGNTHHANVESIVRGIYDHPTIFSNVDWMSAYALTSNKQTIQISEWSRNKTNYFIDLVTFDFAAMEPQPAADDPSVQTLKDVMEKRGDLTTSSEPVQLPAELTNSTNDAPVIPEGINPATSEGGLASILRRFSTLPPNSTAVKSVLIFTDSQEKLLSVAGRSSLSSLSQYAQESDIFIHVVHLAAQNAPSPPIADMDLKQLVQNTGGLYVHYQSPSDLIPLWTRLNAEKQRTLLTYRPSSAQVKAIQVRVMLPDGSYATSAEHQVEFPPSPPQPIAGELESSSESAQPIDASAQNTSEVIDATDAGNNEQSTLTQVASIFGLSEERSRIERGTLLILWALSVGLLFFLVYPELARAWRGLSRFQHTVGKELRRLPELIAPPTLYTAPEDERTVHNGNALSPNSLQNGDRPSGLSVASNGYQQNGSGQNGHKNGSLWVESLRNGYHRGDQRASNNGHTVPTDVSGDGSHIKDELAYLDHDATDIQVPTILGEIGQLLRITYDATLPAEIPIHQMSKADADEIAMYIGRDQQRNTIVIPDQKKRISREHAVLILERGLLYLADNNSVSGTFLNGVRIEHAERKLLRDGDRLGFGNVEYQVQLQSEEATVVNIKHHNPSDQDEVQD